VSYGSFVFSYLRILPTWHCPYSLAAAAAIDISCSPDPQQQTCSSSCGAGSYRLISASRARAVAIRQPVSSEPAQRCTTQPDPSAYRPSSSSANGRTHLTAKQMKHRYLTTIWCGTIRAFQFDNFQPKLSAWINSTDRTPAASVKSLNVKNGRSDHTLAVRECCKGDDESQWERGKFDPRHPKTP